MSYSNRRYQGLWLILIILAGIFLMAFLCREARAEETRYFTNAQIVDAIFLAEGGHRAQYLYGIKSIPYHSETEARQICLNSVRNNVIRWYRAGKPGEFWEFMRNRFCPLSEAKVNKFWVSNVKYFLTRR